MNFRGTKCLEKLKKFSKYALVIMLFISPKLLSQEFNLGLAIGPVYNKPFAKEISGYSIRILDPLTSFGVNTHFSYQSNGLLGVSIEPGYIKKGGKTEYGEKVIANYINAVILLDFNVLKRFTFSLGPEIGHLTKANQISDEEKRDVTKYYNDKTEFSALISFSYSPIKFLDLGVRYSRALTSNSSAPIINVSGEQVGITSEYNQYFQFFARFKISL